MEEEEDEDVVFEGSAIHQHLLDVGFTDFEQTTYLSPPVQTKARDDTAVPPHKKVDRQERKKGCFTVLPNLLFGTVENLLQQYVGVAVARTVFGSKLINEDDWLVLEHFLPEGDELLPSAKIHIMWHRIWVFRDLAVVGACLVLLWMVSSDWLVQLVVILTASIVYTLYCIYLVRRSTRLKHFVAVLKETVYLTSKTVRLLQEVDLIAKGFVLAQGPGASLATPYEEPPQIASLSEALLCTLTSAAKILLSTHTQLEHRVPHHPTIRHLFDEPPPLEGSCSFSQRKQYFKDRATVIKLQTSAVLTKLVLWLYKSKEFSEYKTVCDTLYIDIKQTAFLDKLHFFRKQYEYNKCFWLTERPSKSESQCLEEKKKNVYLAVHSLALHLQAAMVRVQSLEAQFERESDTAKHCDPDSLPAFPSYEHVKEQLTALRLELDSCQGCVEEAEARAERKYGMPEGCDMREEQSKSTAEELVEAADLTKPPPILLYDQEVPPAEDEVFEAYIDQEFAQEDGSKWLDEAWWADARKERQVLRRQKEQGKRVLKELQPILTSRRKMWEEREKVALERHGRKAETSLPLHDEHLKGDKRMENERNDRTNYSSSPSIERASCKSTPAAAAAVTNILTTDSAEEDSDEERLRVYRKVKKELDEDEEERTTAEAGLGRMMLNLGHDIRGFQSLINKQKITTDFGDSDSEEEEKDHKFPAAPNTEHLPRTGWKCEDLTENLDDKGNKEESSDQEKRTQVKVFSMGDEHDKETLDERESKQEEETFIHNEDIGEELDKEASSKVLQEPEEETFTHNEDIDDDDESRKIDWTTFRLPTQQTDTLGDRLHLFSGGACLGFQAEVASQASAASRNFWMTAKPTEETFGGVGEGEEVFGSDSEEEKDSEGDADESCS